MTDDGSRPLLDEQICFALYTASRALIRAYGPILEPLGLTYPQYLAMLVLWEEDGVSVKHLGHRLGLDSATLTPLLKRLERHGFVARSRDPNDERVVRIGLTAEGRALRTRARDVPLEVACRAGLGADEASIARAVRLREELRDLARRLAQDD